MEPGAGLAERSRRGVRGGADAVDFLDAEAGHPGLRDTLRQGMEHLGCRQVWGVRGKQRQ